jgi:hypothetical protein
MKAVESFNRLSIESVKRSSAFGRFERAWFASPLTPALSPLGEREPESRSQIRGNSHDSTIQRFNNLTIEQLNESAI